MSPHGYGITRRRCLAALLAAGAPAFAGENPPPLDIVVEPNGFGGATPEDIVAVTRSAGAEIFRHCTGTRFRQGIRIRYNPQFPITLFDHSIDGRIVVGLNAKDTHWAQFAFQFAHEFGHALMDHANDWTKLWHETRHANQWLAESLCETASLFCLRGMSRTWKTSAPYPNWQSFAPYLAAYAADRIAEPAHQLPDGQDFAAWFRATEPAQRLGWTRERNTIIARQLLPLFEREPAGWDTLSALHLCRREKHMPLSDFLTDWHHNVPENQRAFVRKIAATFSVNG